MGVWTWLDRHDRGALERAMAGAMADTWLVHSVETVRDVADYLCALDEDRVVADLYAARDLGVYVYSFEGWEGGLDLVQCGSFQRVFRAVVKFYRVAVSEAQAVVVRRG